MKFSTILVHFFILRKVITCDVANQSWFRINGIDMRFNLFMFAIVIDLNFSKLSNIEMYVPRDVGDRI